MDSKEFYQESMISTQDPDEAEETLSLCDLPICSNEADWEYNFTKEDRHSSSSSSSEQDYFEFFSQEWSTTISSHHHPENIIFCGKLIPSKTPISGDGHEIESNKQSNQRKKSLFRWNSDSFSPPKSTSTLKKARLVKKNDPNSLSLPEKIRYSSDHSGKCGDKYDFSVGKVSILKSPAKLSRSRRYLFMLGLGRFPMEMELNDIKNRQSRRCRSTLPQSAGGNEKLTNGRGRWKGLWRLVRILGCGGSLHANNNVVKASFGNIPYE
ncbi:unnamed protein product [Ilex paraguariensis]|uniref:Uncharacterized protein n=1 Tax=Ilex paraguariensis TaxID=185542 RepID=A0ABC8S5K4_9AQUA